MTTPSQREPEGRAKDGRAAGPSRSVGGAIEGLYQAAIESIAAGSDLISTAARDFVARDRRWQGSSRRLGHFPENLFEVASEAVNHLDDVRRRIAEAYQHGVADFEQVEAVNAEAQGASLAPPRWLPIRLRAYAPGIDDATASALWTACRARASDCTADEVVYCCRVTADRLVLTGAAGDVDALLDETATCFEGADALYLRYRAATRRAASAVTDEDSRPDPGSRPPTPDTSR
jgi:hypothetical protein